MWLGIHRIYSVISGLVRNTQRDLKQWLSYILKINFGMKLIFCTWFDIHRFICFIQSIYMSEVRKTYVLNSQHVKTELSYWC